MFPLALEHTRLVGPFDHLEDKLAHCRIYLLLSLRLQHAFSAHDGHVRCGLDRHSISRGHGERAAHDAEEVCVEGVSREHEGILGALRERLKRAVCEEVRGRGRREAGRARGGQRCGGSGSANEMGGGGRAREGRRRHRGRTQGEAREGGEHGCRHESDASKGAR